MDIQKILKEWTKVYNSSFYDPEYGIIISENNENVYIPMEYAFLAVENKNFEETYEKYSKII
jgi:hypothetical protein